MFVFSHARAPTIAAGWSGAARPGRPGRTVPVGARLPSDRRGGAGVLDCGAGCDDPEVTAIPVPMPSGGHECRDATRDEHAPAGPLARRCCCRRLWFGLRLCFSLWSAERRLCLGRGGRPPGSASASGSAPASRALASASGAVLRLGALAPPRALAPPGRCAPPRATSLRRALPPLLGRYASASGATASASGSASASRALRAASGCSASARALLRAIGLWFRLSFGFGSDGLRFGRDRLRLGVGGRFNVRLVDGGGRGWFDGQQVHVRPVDSGVSCDHSSLRADIGIRLELSVRSGLAGGGGAASGGG